MLIFQSIQKWYDSSLNPQRKTDLDSSFQKIFIDTMFFTHNTFYKMPFILLCSLLLKNMS